MADKQLFRSNDNRMITGVLGGLGEYFNIDPMIIRLVVVAGGGYFLGSRGIFFATMVLVGSYAAASFLIPEQKTGVRRTSKLKAKPKTKTKTTKRKISKS